MENFSPSDLHRRVAVTEIAQASQVHPPIKTSETPVRGRHRKASSSRWSRLTALVSK